MEKEIITIRPNIAFPITYKYNNFQTNRTITYRIINTSDNLITSSGSLSELTSPGIYQIENITISINGFYKIEILEGEVILKTIIFKVEKNFKDEIIVIDSTTKLTFALNN